MRLRAVLKRIGVDPRYLRRIRWLHKARAVRRSNAKIRRNLGFVLLSPETDNFTYDITNDDQLVQWAAAVLGCPPEHARAFLSEARSDPILVARRSEATAAHRLWTRRGPPFGKRLGWYILARAMRPKLIVEIGIHDGLGSLLLLRALELNAADGHEGRLVSFDVNPDAGWLVGQHHLWEPRFESSAQGLTPLLREAGPLDMFVYDGWHSYEHEYADLERAAEHLASHGVLLSDDSQVTRALAELARRRQLEYFEFHEIPSRHFYPGRSPAERCDAHPEGMDDRLRSAGRDS